MMEDRKRQLMQEALDEALSAQAEQELLQQLEADPERLTEFNQLKKVDRLLKTAPHERAPQRLALTIMARIGQTVKAQHQQETQTEIDEAALQVAMQMVTVATLPMLVGAGWLLLNAHSHPEKLEAVLEQVAGLLVLTVDTVNIMLEEAAAVFDEDPEAAMAMLTLIPVAMLTLVRQVLGVEDEDDLI